MTPPVLTADQLAQPARAAIAWMADAFLREVLDVAPRVQRRAAGDAPDDVEAVHDLRVSLRRLRSWLREWRPLLRDTMPPDAERALRTLSRLAGEARDLEVQRAGLMKDRIQRSRPAGDSARALVAGIDRRYYRVLTRLAVALREQLGPAAAALDAALRREPDDFVAMPMAAAMAEQLAAHVEESPRMLRRVRRVDQVKRAHVARIAVKRFRYLIDTLHPLSPDARNVGRYLATLQDALGELHDAQELAAQARRSEAAPALRKLLDRRIVNRFRTVQRVLGGFGLASAVAASGRVVAELRGIGAGAEPLGNANDNPGSLDRS